MAAHGLLLEHCWEGCSHPLRGVSACSAEVHCRQRPIRHRKVLAVVKVKRCKVGVLLGRSSLFEAECVGPADVEIVVAWRC